MKFSQCLCVVAVAAASVGCSSSVSELEEPTQNEQTVAEVGSLRTTQSCLECHRTDEGELLGAFWYQLLRVPMIEE